MSITAAVCKQAGGTAYEDVVFVSAQDYGVISGGHANDSQVLCQIKGAVYTVK